MRFESAVLREPCLEVKEGGTATRDLRAGRWNLESAEGWLIAREKDGRLRLAFPMTAVRVAVPLDGPTVQKGRR